MASTALAPVPILIATTMREVGPSGVQTHFGELMHYLRERGWPHELVHSFSRAPWMVPAAIVRRGLERLDRSTSIRWHVATHGLSLRTQLRHLLREGKPAIVYAQCPLSAAAALDARANPNQRVILAIHFNISQATEWSMRGLIREGDPVWKDIVASERLTLPRVDGIVFVSEFMRAELSRRIPEIANVPSAIIPNFVRLLPGDKAAADRLPSTDLVCVGSLEPRKNQTYLLDILAAAARTGAPFTLTFIGDGAARSNLMERAKALRVDRFIHFAGFMRDARLVFGNYRGLIHVARMENLPIVLIEAMSHGLPVFATPVGGTVELFEDGREGWVIPLDDADAAASIVGRALGRHDVLSQAASRARERFATRYNAEVVAEQLQHFLVERAGSPRGSQAASR